jgi:hypothetical protein
MDIAQLLAMSVTSGDQAHGQPRDPATAGQEVCHA